MAKRAKPHEVDLDRLCLAMQRDRWTLRRFRTERTRAVQLYVGGHWSDEASWEKQPVNLISLYCQIVGRNLIAKEPRVLLSTFDKQNKPTVHAMQTWANREMVHMRLANTLQRVVLDALFSIGICKVALATPAEASLYSWNLRGGQPFAERVDLDDFVFDTHARDFSECSYLGHRYRVPLDAIRDSNLYSKERKDLTASTDSPYNLEGDERISALLRMPYAVDSQEFEDFVDLWEVYLPRKRLILTLHDDNLSGASATGSGYAKPVALRQQEWIGDDNGPYHILGYQMVPGNSMHKGPIQDLIDLHESTNNAYRKLERQAARMKSLLLVAGGAMDDGGRIQQGNDGDIIRNDNPERARPFSMGQDLLQPLTAIATHFKDLFMMLGGNLEMLGGLAPQSKTLGQDQLLAGNAAGGMADMQQRTIGYVSDVVKSLCWYWWHHPTQVMRSKYQVPGMPDLSLTRQVTPQQRMQARWSDLEIEVDPYSLAHQSPQQRSQALTQLVTTVILPMMPILQQSGTGFDVTAFLKLWSQYNNLPEVEDFIMMAAPPQPDAQPASAEPTGAKPPETTRNYVRRSLGGDTPQNREQQMVESLSNAGKQSRNGQVQGMP